MVVKSTPGISMAMPPSLIGLPVAFLPVPSPQTLLVAEAVPDPTAAPGDWLAPVASAANSSAETLPAAIATTAISFLDLIPSLLVVRPPVVAVPYREAPGSSPGVAAASGKVCVRESSGPGQIV